MLRLVIGVGLALVPAVAMAQMPFEGPLQQLGTSLTTGVGTGIMGIAIAGMVFATLASDALHMLRWLIPLFIGGAILLNADTVIGLFG